jgi:uncharacterized membrane protein YiaA
MSTTQPIVHSTGRPTAAFVGASWAAMLTGVIAFGVGLWNSTMILSEKGFYGTVFLFGLFAAVSLQKAVRDQLEGVPVTGVYLGVAWAALATPVLLIFIGLWNAHMERSEKGFYAMAFTLSMFAAIAVQKNVRDLAATEPAHEDAPTPGHDELVA